MVQKFQSPVRVYKYPFELVIMAYERRFPTCPQMPIVLDCEVIKDEILENGAKRNTSRRCKLAVDAPYIFKKLIGVEVVYFIQNNFLDLANRTLNIEAVNESFSSRIEILEKCRYYAHPDSPDWTCFDQTATLDIKNFFGFEHSMEKMGMKQYTQTTLKGKEIIEYFINKLKEEGITEVPRWSSPANTNETRAIQLEDSARRKSDFRIMLDGDYIAKNLGQLTPMQESKLLELHKMLSDVDGLKKLPSYKTLLRFLIARDWHVNQAFNMLKESIEWREKNNIDNLLSNYKCPNVIRDHFPGGWHHWDIDGRPIYILRLGHMDVKGLLKSVGTEGLLKLTIHICEEGIQRINESAQKLGKPILSWCLLVDLDGLSMRHLWRPGIKALLNIIETVQKNYPETMRRVLVVRTPRVFPIAWTIVSAFIDENTRSKFLFFGGPNCIHVKDGLEQYIDSGIIPDFLGGPCKTWVHEGGLVPKTLYKTNSFEENEDEGGTKQKTIVATDEHQNLYKNINLRAGYIHEVVIKNNDPKSVLTWDFDVHKGELHFTLYRVTELSTHKSDTSTSFFDSSEYVEGENYYREQSTLICRHKESVQGSHVLNHAEYYVMHWFCPHTSDADTSQLNLFYEILSSTNYNGSMTSLEAAGLLTHSATSSCQSR